MKQDEPKIQVTKNGPYLVSGALPLSEQRIATNAKGESLDYDEGNNTRYRSNMRSAAAENQPTNLSATALMPRCTSTVRKPPAISRIWRKPRPLKAPRCC